MSPLQCSESTFDFLRHIKNQKTTGVPAPDPDRCWDWGLPPGEEGSFIRSMTLSESWKIETPTQSQTASPPLAPLPRSSHKNNEIQLYINNRDYLGSHKTNETDDKGYRAQNKLKIPFEISLVINEPFCLSHLFGWQSNIPQCRAPNPGETSSWPSP